MTGINYRSGMRRNVLHLATALAFAVRDVAAQQEEVILHTQNTPINTPKGPQPHRKFGTVKSLGKKR